MPAIAFCAFLAAASAQTPLPELRVEATDGGSLFEVRNLSSQPLTAYLIELVNYPGSSYSLWRDEAAEPIPAGGQRRIPVVNMTVGAAPEYVKLQAALYADGSTAGNPEKAAQLIERRRFVLEITREAIRRMEKAKSAATARDALIAELKGWADALPPAGKVSRNSQAAINQAAGRALIGELAAGLASHSIGEALAGLRASERALGASKPVL